MAGKNRKRKQKRNGRRRRGGGANFISESAIATRLSKRVSVPFRSRASATFPVTATTSITGFNVECGNLGDRMANISLNYAYYRISDLCFRITTDTPLGNLTPRRCAFAYADRLTSSSPTSFDDLCDLPVFMDLGPCIGKAQVLSVPKVLLDTNPISWYKTRDLGDDSLFVQGRMYIGATTAAIDAVVCTVNVTVEGIIQYKDPLDPDFNPVNRHMLSVEEKKVRDDSVTGEHCESGPCGPTVLIDRVPPLGLAVEKSRDPPHKVGGTGTDPCRHGSTFGKWKLT